VHLLKQQTPWLFNAAIWSTKFVCLKCKEEIGIGGFRGE